MMNESEQAIAKVDRLCKLGEKLLGEVDYDLYDRWNDGALKVLDLIFGQSSEPYMSFRFPGGGEAADSRESRVKSAISQKLKVLGFVQQDIADALPIGSSEAHRLVQEAVALFLKERRTASETRMRELREDTRNRILRILREACYAEGFTDWCCTDISRRKGQERADRA